VTRNKAAIGIASVYTRFSKHQSSDAKYICFVVISGIETANLF